MGTLGSPWTALASSMAGPHAGGLAMRPIAARARDGLHKAAEQVGANARELTYMLLGSAHDDLAGCPGESRGGLGGTRRDALVLRSRSSRARRTLGAGQDCFNVCDGLEMHGERG